MSFGNSLLFSEVCFYAFLGGTRTAFRLKLIFSPVLNTLPSSWCMTWFFPNLTSWWQYQLFSALCGLWGLLYLLICSGCSPCSGTFLYHMCRGGFRWRPEEAFSSFHDSVSVKLSSLPASASQMPAALASSSYQLCLLNSGVLLGSIWATPQSPYCGMKTLHSQ